MNEVGWRSNLIRLRLGDNSLLTIVWCIARRLRTIINVSLILFMV